VADKDFFQLIADESVGFFEFVGQAVTDPLAKQALIRDLGGTAASAPDGAALPADKLDAIKAYRDASNPSTEATASALADIALLMNAIASNVETWQLGAAQGAQELGHSLLDIFASNYLRLRLPRTFMLLQAVDTIEEMGSTFGAGGNSLVRIGRAFASIALFLWAPGKGLEKLDTATQITDLGLRLGAAVLAIWDGISKINGLSDLQYGWDTLAFDDDSDVVPPLADAISSRMLSLSLGRDKPGATPADPAVAERLQASLAVVPKNEGGRSAFIALGGSVDLEAPLNKRWMFSLKTRGDGAAAALIGLDHLSFQFAGPEGGASNFGASIGFASQPDAGSGLSFALPSASGSRLEIGQLAFALAIGSGGAEMTTSLGRCAVVIDAKDNDSLVGELLGGTPLRLPFEITFGYSSARGLILEGRAPPVASPDSSNTPNAPLAGDGTIGAPTIAATVPIGRSFGPVTIHEVALRLARAPADKPVSEADQFALEADTSFSAQLGPFYARVERLGLRVLIDNRKPRSSRNLHFVDLGIAIKPPQGIALQIDTALVSGGGTFFHDPDLQLYFGAAQLALRGGLSVKAIGLIATRNADGSKGFSLIVFITVEDFQPFPLGMGFTLQGIGGMLALHRTFDEVAMRAAIPTGQLRNVLFPVDPVHHTAEVLKSLTTLFPARRGSHMAGILLKIGWASPTLVLMDLGVIYEWGNRHRLIVLGRIRAVLPRTDQDVVRINMDALGIVDFDEGTVALDASLVDSKLCRRFVLTGAMALRAGWKGSGGFALAVGGLHPKFALPQGFPLLKRVGVALTTGDNPKLSCQAYFAITSNTVQFGASASLYAAAFGFSVEGEIGFDVLIQLLPFHFLAEYRAGVQLKRGSHNLFKVKLEGALEGPLPLRVRGKATFEILWCDFSVRFDATLVGGGTPNDVPSIDVLDALGKALADAKAWQAELPAAAAQLVSLRKDAAAGVLLHPLGSLSVRQSVVPLNLTRDIERVGTAMPAGARRFTITQATLGSTPQQVRGVAELFAPAQFFEMSDEDKLAAPSFESMDAGVAFGGSDYSFDAAAKAASTFDYKDIRIGADGSASVEPEPHQPDGGLVLIMAMAGAAARAPVRRSLTERFRRTGPAAPPPSLRAPGWAAVETGSTPTPGAPLTWIEAQGELRGKPGGPAAPVLIPGFELAEES